MQMKMYFHYTDVNQVCNILFHIQVPHIIKAYLYTTWCNLMKSIKTRCDGWWEIDMKRKGPRKKLLTKLPFQ